MMAAMRVSAPTLLLACAFALSSAQAAPPRRNYESLGGLERQAVDEALSERGLTIDPAPEGKLVGTIHVFNHEVFSKHDSFLQFLNHFHRTTREYSIRREVLLQPGDVYNEDRLEESTRNMRDEDLSSLMVILPVKSADPAKVDLLVVTRDVWSLRFNTDFRYEDKTLVLLTTSLSENNVLGLRKKAALAFNMDQGAYSVGPSYVDPNIAGTRLTFGVSLRAYFGRESRTHEGWSAGGNLDYPLWSLARKWGAGVAVAASNYVAREFTRDMVRTVDLATLPDEPEAKGLPVRYRARSASLSSYVRRSFGQRVIQRLMFSHVLSTSELSFTDDFPTANPVVRQEYARLLFPPSKRLSAVSLAYSVFTPRYRVYRDFDTFDLREDSRLGPSASASVTRTLGFLGSQWDYVGVGASAGYVHDLADGVQSVSLSWDAFIQDGHLTDKATAVSAKLASPVLFGAVRVVTSGALSVLVDDTFKRRYFMGGGGLRGYAIGEFEGDARFLTHAEVRTRPFPVAALRLGGLLFYDGGDAAPTVGALRFHNDVGFGLRLLIPQLNYYVLRVDWAFALNRGPLTKPGWPGRISAGFRQVF
jgi:hypothetical protein